MIDYERKYREYTVGLLQCIPDVSQDYPNCNGFEKCVISMRKSGWTYSVIQSKLGMPSKKQIREVLLKWAPELIDNSKKKEIIISDAESEIYQLLSKTDRTDFKIDGEDWRFYIENNVVMCEDWGSDKSMYRNWDPTSQQQFLIQIKEQLCQ